MSQAFLRCFLLTCALCCAAAARGGEYPQRPVRLIIPFAPGGATDFGGRLVAAGLSELLGQQFVVDNRGGASGLIGTEIAVRSQPDGYTLLVGNVNAAMAPVSSVPTVICVHNSVTGNTLKEYLDDVLRSEREIRCGTATLSSPGRFIMAAFLKSLDALPRPKVLKLHKP